MNHRFPVLACIILVAASTAFAVTLEKLSLEEMIAASTLIVRGKISGLSGAERDGRLFTDYRLEVNEVLQGDSAGERTVIRLPGGRWNGRTQVFAGVPSLRPGTEYVLFLWRSPGGTLQLVGMSQGLLTVTDAAGGRLASRGPVDGVMLDRRNGLPVKDRALRIRLRELRGAIARAAQSGRGTQR